MAEALLKVLANNIYSMMQQEIGMLWGIENEMQKLASLFTTIHAVIEDAEEKQFKDIAVRNWLQKLTVATHEVDDILDDINLEASKVKYGGTYSMSSICSPWNILFRHKIGKKMKDLTRKLDAIAEERIKFHFNEFPVRHDRDDFNELRETSSILTQPEVFGRDEEREKIVEILVNQIRNNQNTSVLPIVGVGGLGKTTLAQLVFNDQHITEHFGLKLWVCVSDDFNVKRLTKAIIESASRTASEALDLDPLQRKLQEILKGNRYLLVLDDVWNDDQEKWEKLKCVLSYGSRGSAIVITTRMEKVASIMGTLPCNYLSGLSEDYCWSLFKQRAFGLEAEEQPNLVAIGKEIIKKCSGVPLAIKALGGLLRFKRAENEWLFVKESELWNLPQDEMSILPALRLSYHNLPPELRRCFAYCAIYPKDTYIKKHEVILSWIANGIISSNGILDLEDVGDTIWNELYWRSFFQDADKDGLGNVCGFKMHDLVHDLAESVMEGKYPSRELQGSGYGSDSTIRHIKLLEGNKFSVAFPKSIMENSSVIPKFGSVRVFIATQYCSTTLLLSAIANMKHLRYLDLSYGRFSALPNSICHLWNLQDLRLSFCYNLQSLPKHMRCLRYLRYLRVDHSPLDCMPKKIGQLTCLKLLSKFVVGAGRGYQVSELRDLNLEGPLHIENLERVEKEEDAQQVNLHEKQNLRRLYLSWGLERRSHQKNDHQVLEALKPHFNLQRLVIFRFRGTSFPRWMSEVSTLKNIVQIGISKCENCTCLPKFGLLPNLQQIHVSCSPVEYIDESQDGDNITQFPSLFHLKIHDMPFLKGLTRSGVQGRVIFPRLLSLGISYCPMLSLCKNVEFCSISNLEVEDADKLPYSPEEKQQNVNVLGGFKIGELDNQASLTISKELCSELSSGRGFQGLTSSIPIISSGSNKPQSSELEIHKMVELEYIRSLQYLQLRGLSCVALPEVLRHGHTLQHLELDDFPNLISLPQWLGELTVLQSLVIKACPKLQSLPDSMQRMTRLQRLSMYVCPELGRRCDEENGEDWHKIKHIRTRCICNNNGGPGYPRDVSKISDILFDFIDAPMSRSALT